MPTAAPCTSAMPTEGLPYRTGAFSESYLKHRQDHRVAKTAGPMQYIPAMAFFRKNANFSDRCKQEGIILHRSCGDSIRSMGDKITARKNMIQSGYTRWCLGQPNPSRTSKRPLKVIRKIGLPVMIKASAGGGGKGMRLVKEEKDILGSIRAARSEARSAFGD